MNFDSALLFGSVGVLIVLMLAVLLVSAVVGWRDFRANRRYHSLLLALVFAALFLGALQALSSLIAF